MKTLHWEFQTTQPVTFGWRSGFSEISWAVFLDLSHPHTTKMPFSASSPANQVPAALV